MPGDFKIIYEHYLATVILTKKYDDLNKMRGLAIKRRKSAVSGGKVSGGGFTAGIIFSESRKMQAREGRIDPFVLVGACRQR